MARNAKASGPGLTNAAGGKAGESCRDVEEECRHEQVIRTPPKGQSRFNDPVARKRRKLQPKEKKIDELLEKAADKERTGDKEGARTVFDEALKADGLIRGDRFELLVGEQTRAREMDVKVTCRKCGKVLGEFDVVTERGIVKECKASWQQMSKEQFMYEQELVQRPDIFGPGTIVHFAIPKGTRGRLDKKFDNKASMSGKIQEH